MCFCPFRYNVLRISHVNVFAAKLFLYINLELLVVKDCAGNGEPHTPGSAQFNS